MVRSRQTSWTGERGHAAFGENKVLEIYYISSLVSEVKDVQDLSVGGSPFTSLMQACQPEINFVKDIEEPQNVDCDYHLPLGSVPGLIRNDIGDFDERLKDILRQTQNVEAIRDELGSMVKRLLVSHGKA